MIFKNHYEYQLLRILDSLISCMLTNVNNINTNNEFYYKIRLLLNNIKYKIVVICYFTDEMFRENILFPSLSQLLDDYKEDEERMEEVDRKIYNLEKETRKLFFKKVEFQKNI